MPNLPIALWDVTRNKLLKQYHADGAYLNVFLIWSPDGTYLAFASDPDQIQSNHRIVIINVQSSQQIYTYTQHGG